MLSPSILAITLLLISFVSIVEPYASYMTTSAYCSVPLSVGSTIMGSSAVFSPQYVLTVKRGSTVLPLVSSFILGETLTVTFPVSSGTIQFVVQASGGASFTGSSSIGCSGTRVHDTQTVQLTMPSSATGNVTLLAGWGTSYGLASISPPVILLPSKQTLAPLSRAPSIQPAVAIVSSSSSASSASPSTVNLLIGVLVGVGGFITVSMFCFLYFRRGGKLPSLKLPAAASAAASVSSLSSLCFCKAPSLGKPTCTVSSATLLTAIPSALSAASGALCLILVCLWATNSNSTTQSGYLGMPDWNSNPLAYHATFLVGGFFFSQLLAILVWANVPSRDVAKPVHAVVHTVGAGALIVGLVEIVKHVNGAPSPSLTTMHSWTGVMAVSVYGSTYLLGALLALLKWCVPAHPLLGVVDWMPVHRSLGLTGVALTAAAILTGVMDQLPQGTCFYNNMNAPFVDSNPAKDYSALPSACKLANGLGVSAVAAVAFLGVAIMNRHTYKRDKIEPPVKDVLETKDAATSADPTLEDVYSGPTVPTAP